MQVETNDVDYNKMLMPKIPPPAPMRKSTRTKQSSREYSIDEYMLLTDDGEPKSFEKDLGDNHKNYWINPI